jgi:hypothetical protein
LLSIIDWCRSSTVTLEKSGLKRDGPVFFSSAAVKVAGDERTLIAIVAPHRGEASHPIGTITLLCASAPLWPTTIF